MPEHRCYCCGLAAVVIAARQSLCRECAHEIIERAATLTEREQQLQAWRRTSEGQAWIAAAKAEVSLRRAILTAA